MKQEEKELDQLAADPQPKQEGELTEEQAQQVIQDKTPVVELHYTITEEEYIHFNEVIVTRQFAKSRKRTTMMGIVEMVISVLLFFVVMTSENRNQFMILLCLIMFMLGLYSATFYLWMFPKYLKKAAVSNYRGSRYLQNSINLYFYADQLLERSTGQNLTYDWYKIARFQEIDTMYLLVINEKRTILIPKAQIGDAVYEVEAFLKTVCEKFGKTLEKIG